MNNLKIKVMIDGDIYSEKQLMEIEYEREKHVLQEMIHLGAEIRNNGEVVSYDDVNYLGKSEARQILLEAKCSLGADGIRELYQDELERSAQLWREIVKDYSEGEEMIPAIAWLEVSGMTLEQFQKKAALVLSGGDRSVMSEHPEHFGYGVYQNGDTNERLGIETMGMYGGPTEVITMVLPALPAWIPAEPGFLASPCGTSRILDGTVRRDIAHHQMKPTDDGFIIKDTVWFPKNTPQEMIDGHKLHLAIETYEMIKAADTGSM